MKEKLVTHSAYVGLLVWFIALLTGGVAWAEDPFTLAMSIRDRDSSFQIVIWSTTKRRFYLKGDKMILWVKSSADCYLTLIDITQDKSGGVVFPIGRAEDNLLHGGVIYRIPASGSSYQWEVSGSTGKELIKAIATEEPLHFTSGFLNKEELVRFLRNLRELLLQGKAGRWAEAEMWINIRGGSNP